MRRRLFRSPIYLFWVRRKGLLYKRNKNGLGFFIFLFLFLVIAIIVFQLIDNQIMPTVVALSEAKTKYIATEIASEVVNQELADLKYDDLIYLQKDSNSKITALQANIVRMNQISAQMAHAMQKRMSELDSMYVQVPLGNISGNTFLSNRGPLVTIKVIPYGNVDTDFKTEFVSAGINQTRHKIYLEIKSKLLVIVPFVKKGSEIVTKVPVAETVIIGDVPNSYFNLDGVAH